MKPEELPDPYSLSEADFADAWERLGKPDGYGSSLQTLARKLRAQERRERNGDNR